MRGKCRHADHNAQLMLKLFLLTIVLVMCLGAFIGLCRWLTHWSILERHYVSDRGIDRQEASIGSYHGATASISLVKLALAIEIYPSGLWIKPMIPHGLIMKPLSIPWSKIEKVARQESWLGGATRFNVVDFSPAITIKGKAGARIAAVSGHHVPDIRLFD